MGKILSWIFFSRHLPAPPPPPSPIKPNGRSLNDDKYFESTLLHHLLCLSILPNENELISKYNVGLKTLLSEGLSEPECYVDLVYKFKKLIGINDFSFQFRKIITRYRRIGYNLNVMRQSACLVFNPIMVDNYAAFFNCTPVDRASDYDGPDLKLFILVGWGRSFLSVAWPTGVQLVFMPPTLKKLEGHIAFGLSVCVCVCLSVCVCVYVNF